ncbi:HTH-type transcriptional activator RhaS [Lachnospiraceae bacterium]|jgi:YesN/AraC family two-component response regulator|nr:HTH-type transcriptional activator RhaS [Lachnospiraceae bacterium]
MSFTRKRGNRKGGGAVSCECKLFKQIIQTTVRGNFSEYFFKLRMKKALEKLEHADGDMMVYRLAEMVGFADSDYFGRCFRKYTGMSFS